MSSDSYNIGDILCLVKEREGIIRWKGQLHGRDGMYYGVEVTVGKGKHSGKYKDKRYFQCEKGKGLFIENKHIISKKNDNINTEQNLKPKKSKKSKKSKSKKQSKDTDQNVDDILSFLEETTDEPIKENKKKKVKKSKTKKSKKQTDTEIKDNIMIEKTEKNTKDKKDQKNKSKKQKSALELAAEEAWATSSEDEEEKKYESNKNTKNSLKTPKKAKKSKKTKKSKTKEIVPSIPLIYITSKKNKQKYTKKVEIVDEIYVIEDKFIHKRNSLTITGNGKLLCNPWDPITNKKGGIIRVQCSSEIVIEKDGVISASSRGWFKKFGYGIAQKLKHYDVFGGASYGGDGANYYDFNTKTMLNKGKNYGKPNLIKLYPGTGNSILRGGGILELIAPVIINNGIIECNGDGGCTGGSIFICCDKFNNNGKINALGGKKASFCGKGGNGRIAIYCNEYANNGSIIPKPYQHKIEAKVNKKKAVKKKRVKITKKKKKKDDIIKSEEKENKTEIMNEYENKTDEKEEKKSEESIYDIGMNIVENRETIKMNVIYKQNKKTNFSVRDDIKLDEDTLKKQRECKKAIENIINMLMKYEEKISNPQKDVYDKLNINKEIVSLLSTKMGFELMQKHRKLYIKTAFREQMIIGRLVLELKFCKLLASESFMEFSVVNKATDDIFDSNTMATMRYTNGRVEPFNDILPRICWRLTYEYLDKNDKIKKINSDFKFREKSLESKICMWEFEGKEILKYEILIKVDRTKDKYESVLKNIAFADQKSVNISSFYQLQTDKLRRCGFLKIEKTAKLYPKDWYSDTKEGGILNIECIDFVCFGCIDVSMKGQYGKYGKGAGQLKKDKNKKKKNPKRKINKSNENDDYYFGASYKGKEKLKDLVFGCGLVGKKHFKGGGIVNLFIKDHFINYGTISSNGSLSSSGGSIFICCKLFINYGVIQCIGGKEIVEKSGQAENGRIAIYTKVFENHGKILPETNIYIGSFEEGMQIFLNRHAAKRKY